MAGEIEIKEGEGKWITFNVTRNNVAVELSAASDFLFAIKEKKILLPICLLRVGNHLTRLKLQVGLFG